MQERIVIVTGASDGIGRATAAHLARAGAHVVMLARRQAPLEAAAAELREAGGSVETALVDIADSAALDSLIRGVAERHGRLDGLVNNAAQVSMGAIVDTDDATWRQTFAGGADAVFVATRAALRVMQPQGSGSIVNIASTNGERAMPWMGAYSASKAATIHFSRVAAMEAAPHGVRVNALSPGMIMTPGNLNYYQQEPEAQQRVEAAIPAQRGGTPEEVAAAIAFLLSDDATYVNGVCLEVDGGKAAQLYIPG